MWWDRRDMPAHALAGEIREAIDSSDHVIIAIRPWARRFDYLGMVGGAVGAQASLHRAATGFGRSS